jgi:hypothetical protein
MPTGATTEELGSNGAGPAGAESIEESLDVIMTEARSAALSAEEARGASVKLHAAFAETGELPLALAAAARMPAAVTDTAPPEPPKDALGADELAFLQRLALPPPQSARPSAGRAAIDEADAPDPSDATTPVNPRGVPRAPIEVPPAARTMDLQPGAPTPPPASAPGRGLGPLLAHSPTEHTPTVISEPTHPSAPSFAVPSATFTPQSAPRASQLGPTARAPRSLQLSVPAFAGSLATALVVGLFVGASLFTAAPPLGQGAHSASSGAKSKVTGAAPAAIAPGGAAEKATSPSSESGSSTPPRIVTPDNEPPAARGPIPTIAPASHRPLTADPEDPAAAQMAAQRQAARARPIARPAPNTKPPVARPAPKLAGGPKRKDKGWVDPFGQ